MHKKCSELTKELNRLVVVKKFNKINKKRVDLKKRIDEIREIAEGDFCPLWFMGMQTTEQNEYNFLVCKYNKIIKKHSKAHEAIRNSAFVKKLHKKYNEIKRKIHDSEIKATKIKKQIDEHKVAYDEAEARYFNIT